MTTQELYLEQIQQELKQTPVEYLPNLLKIIHSYRESIFSKTSASTIQQQPFDDLFGILTAEHSVSLEEIEQAVSQQGQERFNDCR